MVRSADWAKAEYDNQKSSQTLVTYGSVTGPRIVTSPLTASATVNSSFTYNITASTSGGAPTSYAAIDLPAGLSFIASSGAITGTPTLAGSFSIPLVVSYGNDDGNLTDSDSANDQLGALFAPVNPGDPEQILLNLSIQALPPSVATLAATSISATHATLEGNVTSSGGMLLLLPFIMELVTEQTTQPTGHSLSNLASLERVLSPIHLVTSLHPPPITTGCVQSIPQS